MDFLDYITTEPERKRGQPLGQEERGAIQHRKKQGYSFGKCKSKLKKSSSCGRTNKNSPSPVTQNRKGAVGRLNLVAG